MEKGRKLRRYGRKDYSQVVDFPVEIVSRDGVVRRYSFEDSIRLYQRRIASADTRYDDGDIASAEVLHCRRRIGQLRRSYLVRFGWTAIEPADGLLPSGQAGELAAFLRRCFEASRVAPEDLRLTLLVSSGQAPVWHVGLPEPADVSPDAPTTGFLLYLYPFEDATGEPSDQVRASFFAFLDSLRAVSGSDPQAESLIAFHHTSDCGLVLTGASGQPHDDVGRPLSRPHTHSQASASPLRQAMIHLRRGDHAQALAAFVMAYEADPWRRSAYLGAVMIADQLGLQPDAETAALMGSRYFPDDSMLHYHLALALVRGLDLERAQESLEHLRTLSGDQPPALVLGGIMLMLQGRLRPARSALEQALRGCGEADFDLRRAITLLNSRLAIHRLMVLSMVALGLLATFSALTLSPWLVLVPGGLTALSVALHGAWLRRLRALVQAPGAQALRLSNPAIYRQRRPL